MSFAKTGLPLSFRKKAARIIGISSEACLGTSKDTNQPSPNQSGALWFWMRLMSPCSFLQAFLDALVNFFVTHDLAPIGIALDDEAPPIEDSDRALHGKLSNFPRSGRAHSHPAGADCVPPPRPSTAIDHSRLPRLAFGEGACGPLERGARQRCLSV